MRSLICQHKLGVLIANVDQLASVLAASKPALTAQDKEPNVLTLSAKHETTGYFSLLPVMNVTAGDKATSILSDTGASEVCVVWECSRCDCAEINVCGNLIDFHLVGEFS